MEPSKTKYVTLDHHPLLQNPKQPLLLPRLFDAVLNESPNMVCSHPFDVHSQLHIYSPFGSEPLELCRQSLSNDSRQISDKPTSLQQRQLVSPLQLHSLEWVLLSQGLAFDNPFSHNLVAIPVADPTFPLHFSDSACLPSPKQVHSTASPFTSRSSPVLWSNTVCRVVSPANILLHQVSPHRHTLSPASSQDDDATEGKEKRLRLSKEAMGWVKAMYDKNPFPTPSEIGNFVLEMRERFQVGIEKRQLRVLFQNRRAVAKRKMLK